MTPQTALGIAALLFGCGTEHHNRRTPPPPPSSCTVSPTGLVTCTNGTSYQIPSGSNGVDGQTVVGPKGDPGVAGADGQSIKGDKGDTGSVGASGRDGVDGVAGKDATPVTVVTPCPNRGPFPEVFLRLPDGSILAHWDGGTNNQHFVILTAGDYRLTDGLSNCTVHVSASNEVTWDDN